MPEACSTSESTQNFPSLYTLLSTKEKNLLHNLRGDELSMQSSGGGAGLAGPAGGEGEQHLLMHVTAPFS